MKRILLVICILHSTFNLIAQKFPITADILRQTYIIKTEISQGTCFLIEDKKNDYLITAKHLFKKNLKSGEATSVTIFQENKSIKLNVKYYIHEDSLIDIAVLQLKESIKLLTPLSIGENVYLGQDIYFLGFPNFNNTQFINSGTIGILPLVKKGIISGWKKINSFSLYYIDGHNNPGFSGGPVVLYNMNSDKSEIVGVISGYYNEIKPVKNEMGKDEPNYILENSGIIACYPSILVKQIIQLNENDLGF